MRIVTFNVNGLRAIIKKDFLEDFKTLDADIFCIQETKLQDEQFEFPIEGYETYISSAIKKGYSGTLIYTKIKPIDVMYGIEGLYNDEGRVITLEFDSFYLVNAYVPNAQDELKRLDYRMEYEDHLRYYLKKLDQNKPVIYCGDLNVAHEEIDIKNPKPNRGKAGFSDEERSKMTELLNAGFIDAYREFHPTDIKYSWWSYKFNARLNNAGWRIDYFITSTRLRDKIIDIDIRNDIYGSDHCPVVLDINI